MGKSRRLTSFSFQYIHLYPKDAIDEMLDFLKKLPKSRRDFFSEDTDFLSGSLLVDRFIFLVDERDMGQINEAKEDMLANYNERLLDDDVSGVGFEESHTCLFDFLEFINRSVNLLCVANANHPVIQCLNQFFSYFPECLPCIPSKLKNILELDFSWVSRVLDRNTNFLSEEVTDEEKEALTTVANSNIDRLKKLLNIESFSEMKESQLESLIDFVQDKSNKNFDHVRIKAKLLLSCIGEIHLASKGTVHRATIIWNAAFAFYQSITAGVKISPASAWKFIVNGFIDLPRYEKIAFIRFITSLKDHMRSFDQYGRHIHTNLHLSHVLADVKRIMDAQAQLPAKLAEVNCRHIMGFSHG